ncbi:MAG: hypothetical protein NTX50_02510 [Candidatus Sumerlaeota bacterium]|nr:hypothetical protein [Candidatus Sumerlaeota bacterium]
MDLSLIQKFEQSLSSITERLSAIELSLDILVRATSKRKIDSQWVTLDEAAHIAGTTKRGVQNQVRREREKADGYSLRVRHGGIHRGDWLAFLEFKAQRRVGRGERVRTALEKIL